MTLRFSILFVAFISWFQAAGGAATNVVDSAMLAYNLKTSVTAYDAAGRKDPKWDDEARTCLSLFARARAVGNGNSSEIMDELKSRLPKLVALNCDDPMIRYLWVRFVYSSSHSGADTAAAFGDVAAALDKSDYPAIRKFYGLFWWHNALTKSGRKEPDGRNLLEEAAADLAKALDDQTMAPSEANETCNALMSAPWWTEPTRWKCYKIIEPSLNRHWNGTSVALVAKGRAYLTYAWVARGTGYANTVSSDNWNLMTQRLEIANQALETAWSLDSHNVWTCIEMMRVELGQNKGRDRLETWFRRGMELDPGSTDVCYQKLEYLRPRWYGSMDEMIAFGRDCTTNQSYKGEVRLMLVDAHFEASREIQDDTERTKYWQDPKVWPDIQFAYEQFFKLHPDDSHHRQYYARFADRCHKLQVFEEEMKMSPTTNYTLFGGIDRYNRLMKFAHDQQIKK